jgi:uncharacterized protein (DUF2267 family)
VPERSKADFLARVDEAFETDPIDDVEEAAVFRIPNQNVSEGKVEDARHLLPKDLREPWSAFSIAHAPRAGL